MSCSSSRSKTSDILSQNKRERPCKVKGEKVVLGTLYAIATAGLRSQLATIGSSPITLSIADLEKIWKLLGQVGFACGIAGHAVVEQSHVAGKRVGRPSVAEVVAVPSRQNEVPIVRPTNQRSCKSEGRSAQATQSLLQMSMGAQQKLRAPHTTSSSALTCAVTSIDWIRQLNDRVSVHLDVQKAGGILGTGWCLEHTGAHDEIPHICGVSRWVEGSVWETRPCTNPHRLPGPDSRAL